MFLTAKHQNPLHSSEDDIRGSHWFRDEERHEQYHPSHIAKSTYGFLTGARIDCPGRNSDLGAYRLSPSQIEPMDDLDSLIAATACPGPVSPA